MAPALKANDVLTIFFIRSPADVPLALSAPPDRLRSVGVAAAGPRFTHQIFPNEAIVGYAPGLAIRLLYTAGSMVSYLTVTGAADAVEEAADADGVPDGTPRRGGTDADEAIAPVARPRGVGGGGAARAVPSALTHRGRPVTAVAGTEKRRTSWACSHRTSRRAR